MKNFRKTLSVLMIFALVVSLFAGLGISAAADEKPVFDISTAEQLGELAAYVNAGNSTKNVIYSLTQDIELSIAWTPIGNETNAFDGTFKGNGHKVTNLTIDSTEGYQGLFGNNAGTIEGVSVYGEINITGPSGSSGDKESVYNIAGIAGLNSGTIRECANFADITCTRAQCFAGVAGQNDGTVSECYNAGTIHGSEWVKKLNRVGGIVGSNGDTDNTVAAAVENCYNAGSIAYIGSRYYGGITGFCNKLSTISGCLNVGEISTEGYSIQMNAIIGGVDEPSYKETQESLSADYAKINNNYSLEGLYSGYATSNKPAFNTWLLETVCGTSTARDTLRTEAFLAQINNGGTAWKANSTEEGSCWPVLSWMDASGHIDEDGDYACDICGYAESYTITIAAPEGGTLTVTDENGELLTGTAVTEGTELTVTAEPAEGYTLCGISINGINKGSSVSSLSLAVDCNTEISASFISSEAIAFTLKMGENEEYLTLEQLKAYPTTAIFSKGGTDTEVTGITLEDLFANYYPELDIARVCFYAADGYCTDKATGGKMYIDEADFSYSDVMIVWEGDNASDTQLKAGVNGGTKRTWWGQLQGCDIVASEITINGIGVTRAQLEAKNNGTTVNVTTKSGSVEYSAITLNEIFSGTAFKRIGNAEAAPVKYSYYDTNGLMNEVPGSNSKGFEFTLEGAMLAWNDNSFMTGEVGATAGKAFFGGVTSVVGEYPALINITVSPASAELKLNGEVLSGGTDGVYTVAVTIGAEYSVSAAAAGFTAQSVKITPAEAGESFNISLNPSGSQHSGGGDTPEDRALFSVYAQQGEDGTPVLARTFTANEVAGNVETGEFPYLFYKNGGWSAIIGTKVLSFDTIIAEAGLSAEWTSGSYLKFVCNDGEYKKSYPTYDGIQENKYYFDAEGNATVVPAGIAIEWNSGPVGEGAYSDLTEENIHAIAEGAYDSGSYRLVFGVTEDLYKLVDNQAPAGARMPSGVISMIIVYGEEETPEGTVGPSHEVTPPTVENENKDEKAEPEVSANEDGSFTVSVDEAAEGKPVTVTVPVSEENKGKVLAIVNPDGSRTILSKSAAGEDGMKALVAGGCTVEFVDNTKEFGDVSEGRWYSEVIDYVSSHEIFNGTGEESFAPKANMTRAMMAQVLFNLEAAAGVENGGAFTDVSEGAWYYDAVEWAAAEGIVEGFENGSFGPKENITREQAAQFVYNYLKYLGYELTEQGELSDFADGDSVSGWAGEAMRWAVGAGLFEGDEFGRIKAGDTATRAEVAAIIMRMIEYML